MVLTYDLVQGGERIESLEYRCRRSEAGAWERRLTEDSATNLRAGSAEALRTDPRAAVREARPGSAHLLDRLRKREVDAAEVAGKALEQDPAWEPFDAPHLASLERAFQKYRAR